MGFSRQEYWGGLPLASIASSRIEKIQTGGISAVHDAKYTECDLYKVLQIIKESERKYWGWVVRPELGLRGSVCQTKESWRGV